MLVGRRRYGSSRYRVTCSCVSVTWPSASMTVMGDPPQGEPLYVAETGPTIIIVQRKKLGIAVALLAGFALVAADEGWAGRGHGRSHGGSHRSGLGARSSGPRVGGPAPPAGLRIKSFATSMPSGGSSQPCRRPRPAVIC